MRCREGWAEVRSMTQYKKVAQEDAMGCGLACVASVCGLSYARTKGTLFRNIGDIRRGFYCRELVRALARAGKAYRFHHVKNLPARNLPSDQSFLSAGQKIIPQAIIC